MADPINVWNKYDLINMTSTRSFDLHTTNYIYKPKKTENVANTAFYNVRIITSQVTIRVYQKIHSVNWEGVGELEIRDGTGTCGKNEKGETFGRQIGKQLA